MWQMVRFSCRRGGDKINDNSWLQTQRFTRCSKEPDEEKLSASAVAALWRTLFPFSFPNVTFAPPALWTRGSDFTVILCEPAAFQRVNKSCQQNKWLMTPETVVKSTCSSGESNSCWWSVCVYVCVWFFMRQGGLLAGLPKLKALLWRTGLTFLQQTSVEFMKVSCH